MEVVQYIGGCSVHRGITSVLWGDSFSTVEVVQYSGGQLQYCGGIASVLWRCSVQWEDNISTCGGLTSVLWRITSVQWRITSVLWRDTFSTLEGYLQYCGGITAVHLGDSFSTVGGTFSTVEVVQYSGG